LTGAVSQFGHCSNCSCVEHAEGKTTRFHSAITRLIVSPGHSQVVPLRPEFITPQDGRFKQDCEITAAKRWLATPKVTLPVTPPCWATISTRIKPSAGRCCCLDLISCSPASLLPLPRSTNGSKIWKRAASLKGDGRRKSLLTPEEEITSLKP
jgi:hypothetical protein